MLGFDCIKPVPLSMLLKSGFGVAPALLICVIFGEVAGDKLGFIPPKPASRPRDKLLLLLPGTSFCSS